MLNNYKQFHLIINTLSNAFKFESEYKFLKTRKFRFDFAQKELKIAIEIEGGVYTNGRHTRGKGFISDMQKYNLATLNGWQLLRFTPQQTKKSETIQLIKELIDISELNKLLSNKICYF
ncbi:MAG: hypothetical protein ACRC0V_13040 [Fusobacteriaceae bacterium]